VRCVSKRLPHDFRAKRGFYCADLQLAAPLSVGSHMKWGLARLVNDRGGRGFVSWELYNDFKQGERGELEGAGDVRAVNEELTLYL
jgi:hypothetical protein